MIAMVRRTRLREASSAQVSWCALAPPNGSVIQLPRADPQRGGQSLGRQDTTTWDRACGVSWTALLGGCLLEDVAFSRILSLVVCEATG